VTNDLQDAHITGRKNDSLFRPMDDQWLALGRMTGAVPLALTTSLYSCDAVWARRLHSGRDHIGPPCQRLCHLRRQLQGGCIRIFFGTRHPIKVRHLAPTGRQSFSWLTQRSQAWRTRPSSRSSLSVSTSRRREMGSPRLAASLPLRLPQTPFVSGTHLTTTLPFASRSSRSTRLKYIQQYVLTI
jgi:hypothetical protein